MAGTRAVRAVIAVALATCAGSVAGSAGAAVVSGTNGLIVTNASGGAGPMIVIDPNTGTRTLLTGSVAGDSSVRVAPNAARVAFLNGGNVWFADFPSGLGRTQVTSTGGVGIVNWSPDSAALVFDCATGICTSPAAPNAPVTTLPGSLVADVAPDFSPDGQFVVVSAPGTGLIRLNANATGGRTKLLGTTGAETRPVVAPNGSVVYFDTGLGGTGIEYVSWPNGGSRTVLGGTLAGDRAVAPSPDGTKVAFSAGPGGATTLFTLNTNGTGGRATITGSVAGDFFSTWARATAGAGGTTNAAPVFSADSACGGSSVLRILALFGPGTAGVSASDTAGQSVSLTTTGLPGYVDFNSTAGNPATGLLSISANPTQWLNLVVAILAQSPSTVTVTATDNGSPVASATCAKTVRIGIV